mmetsp:Transcript_19761/g.42911  ORF Transcript_19761/g.42911 Transcript_19761/m.42911 type:complete len:288 (+) Transcript_19761:1127-1990(+)
MMSMGSYHRSIVDHCDGGFYICYRMRVMHYYSLVFQRMIAGHQSHDTDENVLPLLVSSTLLPRLLDDVRSRLVEIWNDPVVNHDDGNDCYTHCSFAARYHCPVRLNCRSPFHHADVGCSSSSFYPFASCAAAHDDYLHESPEILHDADRCIAAVEVGIHDCSVPAHHLLHDNHPRIAACLGMDRAREVHNHAVATAEECLHNPSSEDVACKPAALAAAVVPPAAALTAAVACNYQEGMPPDEPLLAVGYNTDRVVVPRAQEATEAFQDQVAVALAAGPWDRELQAAY